MDNKFTKEELKYVNADIYDKSQDIYVYTNGIESKILPNKYNIKCVNLPQGKYIVSSTVNFHKNTKIDMAWGHYFRKIEARYTSPEQFGFDVLADCEFVLKSKLCKPQIIHDIVHSLRTQAVINARNLSQQQESLIAKDIKSRTDLGEEYNRESFYGTLHECLQDGTHIEIDPNNTLIDADTISLHSAKLIQDQINIARKKRELFSKQAQYKEDLKNLNDKAQSLNNRL